MAFSRSKFFVGAFVLAAALSMNSDRIPAASSDGERTISFFNIHTEERLTIVYKRNGRYVPEAMKKINWIMRDWRQNKVITISPETIDLAWEMHEELGSREPINIICGYRSPATNNMLRRTRGGQAKQSQHITGRAIDITFPDVPLKQMRYSALVRERGGVGYYPTSGIPFVHIDTASVRAWPRLPRHELALLFPSGRTRHRPASGGPITPNDVKIARSKYKDLSVQVAQYRAIHLGVGKQVQVAMAIKTPKFAKPAPKPEQRSYAVASLAPSQKPNTARPFKLTSEPIEKPLGAAPAYAPAKQQPLQLASYGSGNSAPQIKPALLSAPKLLDRPSRFTPATSDRNRLDALVAQAASMKMPELVSGPKPAVRPRKQLAAVAAANGVLNNAAPATTRGPQVASLGPHPSRSSITDMDPDGLGNGWVQAPEFDEDHPEELAYRPFPLAPFLTDSPSSNDPSLALGLQHPDIRATLAALDDDGAVAPMRFRPGRQLAQLMWAEQFQGKAVHLEALKEIDPDPLPNGLENRQVKTTSR